MLHSSEAIVACNVKIATPVYAARKTAQGTALAAINANLELISREGR